ncbi:DUF1761 domain-containing protein [Psychroserpens algicola]|uniref:DUF1761 domain-containing protein n=1 Tax=Psychroserpens algicola TaxID=1719034 RepID=A0ABT0H612_9FLAO|nr:DUF1761 domain-containing protein [Psychroserpens algicola]MCK8479805.1 DUF1761 domain-containing protein [Psychroserpens algicola]
MENINHLAVILSAFCSLILGAIWYSPILFYKTWKKENNLTDEQLKASSPAKSYLICFLLALLMSYNMAFFLADSESDWQWGLIAGFLTGFGWAAAIFMVIAMFELKTWRYVAINSGYIIIFFSLIGVIIGTWK